MNAGSGSRRQNGRTRFSRLKPYRPATFTQGRNSFCYQLIEWTDSYLPNGMFLRSVARTLLWL